MKRIISQRWVAVAGVVFLFWGTGWADTAVWTGQGANDSWNTPENWLNGRLPGRADRITFAAGVDWLAESAQGNRYNTVTINQQAQAAELSFHHYGQEGWPFQGITVTDGANLSLGNA